MHVVYDTSTVHALDRYAYYQAGCAKELAPVSCHGREPGRLLTTMSVAQIDDFEIANVTWSADSAVTARRTERLIRACDPECYRMYLVVSGTLRLEQADNRVELRARDMALYDLSHPFQAIDGIEPGIMREVMLSFPRSWVPIARTRIRPLIGTVMPRNLSGRSLLAQFLIELTATGELTADPGLAEVLRECTVGLIRQRLGLPSGISPHTFRLLHMVRIRYLIRRDLGDARLNVDRIARAVHMSPRSLHKIFQDAELTPMQLLKRLRLEECHRSLQDPALVMTPIRDIIARHGYRRPDQFARDFKQLFGVSPTQVRRLTGQRPSEFGRETGDPLTHRAGSSLGAKARITA